MGRAPCCDKANVKRGPWSPEEDATLKRYVETHGTGGNWIALPQKAGLKRCGKSCRLRWLNYLRPDIKHGNFTEDEDQVICTLYSQIGSRWSIIASQLPRRTDNDVKNYWNTKLKKRLLAGKVSLLTSNNANDFPIISSSNPTDTNHLHDSTPSISLSKSEACDPQYPASPTQLSSSPSMPLLTDHHHHHIAYGMSTVNPHHFIPPHPAGMSFTSSTVSHQFGESLKNSPVLTSSQEGSSVTLPAGNNVNGGAEDADQILMDFGFGSGDPYDQYYVNNIGTLWYNHQEIAISHDALSWCPSLLAADSSYADIKPQGLNQSVINQY